MQIIKDFVSSAQNIAEGLVGNSLVYQVFPYIESSDGLNHFVGLLTSLQNTKKYFSFSISGNHKTQSIYAFVPAEYEKYFENSFYSHFPTASLQKTDFSQNIKNFISFKNCELKTQTDFVLSGEYIHPLNQVFAIFSLVSKDEFLTLNFGYQGKTTTSLENLKTKLLSQEQKEGLYFSLGIETNSSDSSKILREIKNVFQNYCKTGKINISILPSKILASIEQVSNFFYLPNVDISQPNLKSIYYRRLPAPANIPTFQNTLPADLTILGTTDYKNDQENFGVKKIDKLRHIYIIGKTGSGKSTLINNMTKSDMENGFGIGVVDPHGDLIDNVIADLPEDRKKDVVLFDVSDRDFPIGFNIFDVKTPEQKLIVVSGILSTFKKLYGDSRGPRLEYILRNALLSIIEYPGANMLHILRMLTDKDFRNQVLEYTHDPVVKKFWTSEFGVWTDKFREEAVNPIINKVGQYLSSPIIRNIFGQSENKLNIRQIMDEGKILLVNLSKGKIGEDTSYMIGAFLVTKFQIESMARADMLAKDRRPFFLYIDEFQNFATESFESIFSESRKYNFGLVVANQYISQLDEKIKNAIFGNIGTIMSFGVGREDAEFLSLQFKSKVGAGDLLSLPRGGVYIRLMIDGIMSDVFSMTNHYRPIETDDQKRQQLLDMSRSKYGSKKSEIETIHIDWANQNFSPTSKAIEKAKQKAKEIAAGDSNRQNNNGFSIQPSENIARENNNIFSQKNNLELSEKKSETENLETQNIIQDIDEPVFVPRVHEENYGQKTDLEVGKVYTGVVKIKFNYGLFVLVGENDGLLHKSMMKLEPGVSWKKMYEVGDEIQVKFQGFNADQGGKILFTQI